MKILWLCNIIIPQICSKLNIPNFNVGGWLNQIADKLDNHDEIELAICAPYSNCTNRIFYTNWGNDSLFFGFYNRMKPYKYNDEIEKVFKSILNEFNPDIVHIFGTEYPHTLAMTRAFANPERTVIHIQGLVSVCAKHYYAMLPQKVIRGFTLRDFLKNENIKNQKKKFEIRGKFEIEALKNVSHVMGRTDWDFACVSEITPNIQYHYVQEMMREIFYKDKWKLNKCEKHRIFMSQGSYPIKGLHIMLEALHILKKRHMDVKLYVAGSNIVENNSFQQSLRKTYYAKYIERLIKIYELKHNVFFTGILDECEMKKQYLESHVFVSCSSIENSPNSIGEAMLMGVPVVASNVGGIQSLVTHQKEGLLYQFDAPYMLAYYIDKIFNDDKLAECLSEKTYTHAIIMYNKEKIFSDLLKVYKDVISNPC